MAAEELRVRGLTGVDILLPIAGIGRRSYAFLIDWHIRALLALAWVLLSLLAILVFASGMAFTEFSKAYPGIIAWGMALPASVLYFLYHPVLELLLRGRTPGKRMAGVRIVTVDGATPGPGALLLRNLFRLIDNLPVFYGLGLVCCLFTVRQVRIGDLAAGTLLVIDEGKPKTTTTSLERIGALVRNAGVDPRAAALVQDLLDRWKELEPEKRKDLARGLLKRLSGATAEEIDPLDPRQLRTRLQGLIGGA